MRLLLIFIVFFIASFVGSEEQITPAEYDPNLAYKMVFLSALAYADVVENYTARASEVDTFGSVRQVTKNCPGNALCSGFVAVSHTEKAIAIAFRGSQHIEQVMKEMASITIDDKVSFPVGNRSGEVQNYFYKTFHLIWRELKYEVYEQIRIYPSYKVWVTGHSLGGALASLASTALVFERTVSKEDLVFYSFGQPRVGDYDYARTHDIYVPTSYRVTHYRDAVVNLPLCRLSIAFGWGLKVYCNNQGGYPYHHGIEIHYDQEVMTKYMTTYKVCTGFPRNEDRTCSFSKKAGITGRIEDHKIYFGVSVGTWWSKGERQATALPLFYLTLMISLIL